jgi:hypothetical protein
MRSVYFHFKECNPKTKYDFLTEKLKSISNLFENIRILNQKTNNDTTYFGSNGNLIAEQLIETQVECSDTIYSQIRNSIITLREKVIQEGY